MLQSTFPSFCFFRRCSDRRLSFQSQLKEEIFNAQLEATMDNCSRLVCKNEESVVFFLLQTELNFFPDI